MLTDTRPLKLAQSKTTRAIFFLSNNSFSNIACSSFGAEIWGPGRHVEKRKKNIASCTKPFPGKAQALGWSGHVATLPPRPL